MILVCNCPEGVVEVLDFMDSAAVDSCDKVARMRARKFMSWDELENHPRRLDTIEKLKELVTK